MEEIFRKLAVMNREELCQVLLFIHKRLCRVSPHRELICIAVHRDPVWREKELQEIEEVQKKYEFV